MAKWGIGCASPSEIDRDGIVPALTLAAQRAYRAMGHPVDLLLLDRGLSLRDRRTRGATLRDFVASGFIPDVNRLVPDGRRPSSKASTAEHAKDAEHCYKKEGLLCGLGDLGGEMKRPSVASGFMPDVKEKTSQTNCDTTPELAFTKGDTKSLHIAAASILAKVSRDRMMARVHIRFPNYGFDRNKGYGTAGHLAALRQLGPSPIHRRSFRVH